LHNHDSVVAAGNFKERTLRNAFTQTGARWLWITLFVLLLDRLTKSMILHSIKLHHIVHITSFYNITLAYNRGAAFSLLSTATGWQGWLFSGIALAVSGMMIIWLCRLTRRQWWESIAVSLILGGALGNVSDRFIYGHVIDFIQWHWHSFYWPVFNVADSAICMGATMLVMQSLLFKVTRKK
jgi:signal peptidase II